MSTAREAMTPAGPFARWAERGFGGELVPVCGPRHDCASPGKIPHHAGWQTRTFPAWMLSTWRGNLGLRTQLYPALDLDVEDLELADELERVVLVALGNTARRTRRNTARRLLLYRLEGAPFSKVAIAFRSLRGDRAKIEILAAGQQCVVAGIHHTGAAIGWPGGQPVAASLEPMTAAGREQLLAALRRRLSELGCEVEGAAEPERRAARPALPPSSEDAYRAEAALRRLDPDCDYETWIRAGMALHARWPSEVGLELWDAWSAGGRKYPGRRVLERHWRSFSAGGGIGLGTLIALAARASP